MAARMSAWDGLLSLRERVCAACAQSGLHVVAMYDMEPVMLRNLEGSGLVSARSMSRRGVAGRGVVVVLCGMEWRFMRRSI